MEVPTQEQQSHPQKDPRLVEHHGGCRIDPHDEEFENNSFIADYADKLIAHAQQVQMNKQHKTKGRPSSNRVMFNNIVNIQNQLQQIKIKQEDLKSQMKKLEQAERSLKTSQVKRKQGRAPQVLSKEEVSLQKDTIKKLKKQYDSHKNHIQQQIKHKIELENSQKIAMQLEREKRIEEFKEKRLGKVKENIVLIEKRTKHRKEKIQVESKEISRLKSNQKLFEKLQRKSEEKLRKIQQQQERKREERRRLQRVTFDDIKIHEQVYLSRMEKIDQNRKSRHIQSNVLSKEWKVRFLSKANQELIQMKQRENGREQEIQQNISKMNNFSHMVRQGAKKYLRSTTRLEDSAEKDERRSLDRGEVFKRGNQYMRSIKETLSLSGHNSMVNLQMRVRTIDRQANAIKVQDYLKQRRMVKRQKQTISSLLGKGQIESATKLVKTLQSKSVKFGEMYKGALNKLKILERLQQISNE